MVILLGGHSCPFGEAVAALGLGLPVSCHGINSAPARGVELSTPKGVMVEIVGGAQEEPNKEQGVTNSVEQTPRGAGQGPWVECGGGLGGHLQPLVGDPMYKGDKLGESSTKQSIESQEACGLTK